ncbi:MAG: hypothetical protein NWE83_06245 [Candidatus Bathyarchaeota archaeon]|nr:hypothetical protein [Candidatus Bathyarchaeota archaeon]
MSDVDWIVTYDSLAATNGDCPILGSRIPASDSSFFSGTIIAFTLSDTGFNRVMPRCGEHFAIPNQINKE